jgi:hypothetical protein
VEERDAVCDVDYVSSVPDTWLDWIVDFCANLLQRVAGEMFLVSKDVR